MNTVEILKSLSDETRLTLIRNLAEKKGEISGSELIAGCAKALQLSQPTLSHHYSRLTRSGVLLQRKVGTEHYYKLNTDLLKSIGIDASKL